MGAQRPAARTRKFTERTRHAPYHVAILAVFTALFAIRVAAQAMQRWFPVSFLPPFDAFQGSALPYGVLLFAQFAILALMVGIAWRIRKRALLPRPHVGRALAIASGVYLATMLTRLAIGLCVPAAPAWFRGEIPVAFHLVLASFVLVLAMYHRQVPR